MKYNALRQPEYVLDSKNQYTIYQWCRCGDLRKLIDTKGQITTWLRDVQGRVLDKDFSDDSKISYTYQPLSGRLDRREIRNDDGSINYFSETDFDFLGRVKQTSDNLGVHRVEEFDGDTARANHIVTRVTEGGKVVMNQRYAYSDSNDGKRLSGISNQNASDVEISGFGYNYTAVGQIKTWEQRLGGDNIKRWTMKYDPVQQLTGVEVTDGADNTFVSIPTATMPLEIAPPKSLARAPATPASIDGTSS